LNETRRGLISVVKAEEEFTLPVRGTSTGRERGGREVRSSNSSGGRDGERHQGNTDHLVGISAVACISVISYAAFHSKVRLLR
jgi:hypothetical protein